MNEAEWQTRKQRIDSKLRAINPAWQIIPWLEGSNCSELTPSLLARAFAGQLVPQNPADEPAVKLLARMSENRRHG